ncbi:uncharacterized protein K460DRAFT_286700 [Cucurbitaria berberidis CBS 394.84]|uniref:Uncharacterized protein n=1 Tax=Cucurbitaria berberidis CBS 394.84 TaxID=1168544 RepID=A0A9P4GGC6_9PLEO|nr:uncharacterized protein K460DRAFT_286700 [Cucurbitaria berberidis CBS 394.84]KAF1844857.1 hypothetical protein K460DRAFT_286700 [Cucurbitaria berberidis CBS 394.84]
MASSFSAPFRFRDLPSEIRNKIYRNLLCEVSPAPTTVDTTDMFSLALIRHSIDSALLRTSTEIYHEAYAVLIKTNRFVKITVERGVPLRLLIKGLGVRVITENKALVERFKGYVLAVHLGRKTPSQVPEDHESAPLLKACNLMILHRDMEKFCEALTDGDAHTPGFSECIQISITVAPVLNEMPRERYTPSLEEFFSEKTQETLVAPFRKILRGYNAVTLNGHIADDLAKAVREDMGQEKWSDPRSVLEELLAAKQNGSRLFQERKFEEACLCWQDAVVDIEKIIQSSSWVTLVRRGGEPFFSQLAELYFLMRLNIAHIEIFAMQKPGNIYFACLMAEDALKSATRSLKKGFWARGYKYQPSIKHLAKLWYRYALFLRLQGEPGTEEQALMHINKALRLQPDDAAILKEKQNILASMQ